MVNVQKRLHDQSGTAAVEFGLVFPLLFGITYAAIVYGFVYFTQLTLNFASQEAARSVVRVDPTSANYTALIESAAQTSLANTFQHYPILNGNVASTLATGSDSNGPTFLITLNLPSSVLRQAGFASIPLPFNLGTFPPLPPMLTASATIGVN